MPFIIILLLFPHHCFASSQRTPHRQMIPSWSKEIEYTNIFREERPTSPLQIPMTAPLLFQDPIIIESEKLFALPCTTETVHNVLKIIDPDFNKKSNDELWRQKLTPAQEITLHRLLEKILQQSDSIISSTNYNFIQETNPPSLHPNFVKLKKFSDFPIGSDEQKFLKAYRFLAKAQTFDPVVPKNFNGEEYINSAKFDWFFESNSNRDQKNDPKQLTPFFITLLIHPTLTNMTKMIAKVTESNNNDAEQTEITVLKKRRIESDN